MKDIVRLKLIEIVTQYGQIVIENPPLVKGLLRDFCGDHKREINGLMDALHEGVPVELRAAGGGTPPAVLLARLTRRLIDDRSMVEETARWVVESWAMALGVIPQNGAQAANSAQGPEPVQSPQPGPAFTRQMPPPATPIFTQGSFEPEMVRVPAGAFWMGSQEGNKDARDWEKPYHKVYLDEYWIGKAPVMVAEFRRFAEQSGYRTMAENKKDPFTWRTPRGEGSNLVGKERHPVTCVSWEDAIAYCHWLSRVSGRQYGLPGEAQWEKAARGTDGRIYPWGNAAPDKSCCNIDSWFGETTPVGKFSPAGDSPYGSVDMMGNAWEWCADWWSDTYYQVSSAHNPTGPSSGEYRSVRGGSWNDDRRSARCASRNGFTHIYFGYSLGFRVVSPGVS